MQALGQEADYQSVSQGYEKRQIRCFLEVKKQQVNKPCQRLTRMQIRKLRAGQQTRKCTILSGTKKKIVLILYIYIYIVMMNRARIGNSGADLF